MPRRREDGSRLEVHFSTHLPGDLWTVELRLPGEKGTEPFFAANAGERLQLPGKAELHILAPYQGSAHPRLWLARIVSAEPVVAYLERHGFPIRYRYVPESWPNEYYQTIYATEVGSAEMPSAGRGFTADMIMRLVAKGVQVAPLILHTGVSSQESHKPPYEEYYRVLERTAQIANLAREMGKRVMAVGTTTVRALETATDSRGVTQPGQGWTSLVITANDPMQAVDCLLTGLHEPEATHLGMLGALAGARHVALSYREALREGYLWHEFGDLHLIMQ
jgi:S-adenosylmethionine:tRNA ribosyltransferase-isomerase